MILSKAIAVFLALINAVGLPGNLLVIVTIVVEKRFHRMRYGLLASLALSDFLLLILYNSFRIASTAEETWLYGQTMCHLNPTFARYFYFNTVLHLVAVSYERYKAIVKEPLVYDGKFTKCRVLLMVLLWIIPVPLLILPFVGVGRYVYNPELFVCEPQPSTVKNDSTIWIMAPYVIISFGLPFLVILSINLSVFKTAMKHQAEIRRMQATGKPATRRVSASEHKAAIDVGIIIVAFLVCFLPNWIIGTCRFLISKEIPAEAILVTNSIFAVSALCNPIIYSIRKREFRSGVKNLMKRIGLCGPRNEVNGMDNVDSINKREKELGIRHRSGRLPTGTSTATASVSGTVSVSAITVHESSYINMQIDGQNFHRSKLSPIPECSE